MLLCRFFSGPALLVCSVRVCSSAPALLPCLLCSDSRHHSKARRAQIRIVKEEGPVGLFRGAGPTVVRAMALNMGMLASNDQVRAAATGRPRWQDRGDVGSRALSMEGHHQGGLRSGRFRVWGVQHGHAGVTMTRCPLLRRLEGHGQGGVNWGGSGFGACNVGMLASQ